MAPGAGPVGCMALPSYMLAGRVGGTSTGPVMLVTLAVLEQDQ